VKSVASRTRKAMKNRIMTGFYGSGTRAATTG